MQLVRRLEDLCLDDLAEVGGKNASLGEMLRSLAAAGVRVPAGFALTSEAYREHLRGLGGVTDVLRDLEDLDVQDVGALAEVAGTIRRRLREAPLPDAVAREARAAYEALGDDAPPVAVRSSATAEDLPSASFAGQQDTYLGVSGWAALDLAIRRCMASLFTDRAIVYRSQLGITHRDVALSVGVQRMVRSDRACAGTMFTLDPDSGFRDVVLIDAVLGLGETLVQGRVEPDEYVVHKPTLAEGFRPLVRRTLGAKQSRLVLGSGSPAELMEQEVPEEERRRFVLTEDEVLELARIGVAIEEHYSARAGQPMPMDIEWGKDGPDGPLYVLQARPETVHSRQDTLRLERFRLTGRGTVLVRGKAVGARVGRGPVRQLDSPAAIGEFRAGDVLVTSRTDPDWEPILRRAAAVVTEQGGRTCHAAIVTREHGIPCIVGAEGATRLLTSGDEVTVSCAEGEEGRVYAGLVEFEREDVALDALPTPPVKLMLNLADPDLAFGLARLPVGGVGLARTEFIVSNRVGAHPMAFVAPERVADPDERARVLALIPADMEPEAFFVERLASGVAQIAAAFFPRPVIVRFSDFKTNEYAGLLGGSSFEPHEENPMIGFRGASRYYDERYRAGFALECRAIRRVRDTMGLANVEVMVPFCRTLGEGRAVLDEMAANGLEQGGNDLRVWMMCEIPNNVILAGEFSALFDGFSIGSNDLTQLTLGVDRDSELLAHLFDESDPGVKRMIERVVAEAHRCGRPVGLCGQAPSHDPEFAAFLVDLGIDSISLDPDSILPVIRRLAGRATAEQPQRGPGPCD